MSQSFKADYTQNHPTSFDTNYHGQSASYSRDSQYAGQHTQHESESKYSSAATYVANDDGLMPSYSSKQNLLDDPQSRYISVDPESQNPKASNWQPLDYQNAPEPVTSQEPRKGWRAFMPEGGLYPLEQRIEAKRRGLGRQKYPFISWAFAIVMTGVLIYELVLNNHFQGTPLSFKPVVNPMLGPSQSALVTVGGRFPPCMKLVEGIPSDTKMACLNNTANPPDQLCSLEETCAFGGFHKEEPNQWFRFITPIFIHAGIIHLLLNMLAQSTSSAQIEREMGSGGFLLLYMAAGIFGNVLGGNFALVVAPSVGASGAIFGTIAATWVDLFAHWRLINRPGRRLAFQTLELVIGVIFGYIPYVDNFAHLGGFFMGLIFSMIFYPIISVSNRHKTIVWAMRIAAIPIAIVMFVVLIRNFYTSNPYASCDACRYLSCFPLKSNNYCRGNNGLTTVTVPSNPSSI